MFAAHQTSRDWKKGDIPPPLFLPFSILCISIYYNMNLKIANIYSVMHIKEPFSLVELEKKLSETVDIQEGKRVVCKLYFEKPKTLG